MKATTTLAALFTASALTLGGIALADDNDDRRSHRGEGGWMSVEDVAVKLRGQGYTLLEIERDDGKYEAKVVNRRGERFEVDLNRRTGEPVSRWERKGGWSDDRDDDRYDD